MKLKECTKCNLCKSRTQVITGTGCKDTCFMFIGESPNKNEDIHGKQFIGNTGKMFDDILQRMKLNRKMIWLTNVVKCHTLKNRTPLDIEIDACKIWLNKEIAMVKPKIIITLGIIAEKFIRTNYDVNGTFTFDNIKNDLHHIKGIDCFLFNMIHPAMVLHSKKNKRILSNQLDSISQWIFLYLDRCIPTQTSNKKFGHFIGNLLVEDRIKKYQHIGRGDTFYNVNMSLYDTLVKALDAEKVIKVLQVGSELFADPNTIKIRLFIHKNKITPVKIIEKITTKQKLYDYITKEK